MSAIDSVKQKAVAQRQRAERLKKQAEQRVPPKYRDFLLDLEQKVKLANFEAKELDGKDGIVAYGGKTYAEITLPYVSVDGRVQMAIDEHLEAKKTFSISLENEWVSAAKEFASVIKDGQQLAEALKLIPEYLKNILKATLVSEIYGTREGRSKIGIGGSGVDSTNPIENSETSSIGRALGFMGYGLLGGGIASYEEVKEAVEEREKIEQKGVPAPAPKPAPIAKSPNKTNPTGATPPPDSSLIPLERTSPSVEEPVHPIPAEVDDPAKTQTEGPCADCGKPFEGKQGKALETFILNRRKAKDTEGTIRWSHQALPGGKCPE